MNWTKIRQALGLKTRAKEAQARSQSAGLRAGYASGGYTPRGQAERRAVDESPTYLGSATDPLILGGMTASVFPDSAPRQDDSQPFQGGGGDFGGGGSSGGWDSPSSSPSPSCDPSPSYDSSSSSSSFDSGSSSSDSSGGSCGSSD